MAALERLAKQEATAALAELAQQGLKALLSVRAGNRWVVCAGRPVALDEDNLWLVLPGAVEGADPRELLADKKIGVSFRMGNHRYFFASGLTGVRPHRFEGFPEAPAYLLRCPEQVHRLGRRAARRVDVPADRVARAMIWLGGQAARVQGEPDVPVWSGSVTSLGVGGFQLRSHGSSLTFFEPGDLVGVRMTFDAPGDAIDVDAEFRHGSPGKPMSLLAFRFVALEATPQSRSALDLIARQVARYQRP